MLHRVCERKPKSLITCLPPRSDSELLNRIASSLTFDPHLPQSEATEGQKSRSKFGGGLASKSFGGGLSAKKVVSLRPVRGSFCLRLLGAWDRDLELWQKEFQTVSVELGRHWRWEFFFSFSFWRCLI